MSTIGDLCVTSSVSSADKLPIWSNANGVTRALPISVLDSRYLTQDDIASFAVSPTSETFVAGVGFIPGVSLALTLANQYFSTANIEVFFDAAFQGPDQYSLVGFGLVFVSPIPVGVQNVYVRGGATRVIDAPSNGTVTDSSVASGTKLYNRINDIVDARDFGVRGDGVTDDTTALFAAIASLPSSGGYVDCSRCPIIKVSNTINIGNGTLTTGSTINNVFLIGAGGTGPFAGDSGTVLRWNGANGGTVLQFLGAMTGGGLLGGWVIDGAGIAARGLVLNHLEGGQFPRLKIKRCTGVYTTLMTQTNPDPIGGCRNNRFGVLSTDTVPPGAVGLMLDGITALLGNSLQNVFDVVDIAISGTGAIGIQLGYADFNVFNVVDISIQSALVSSVGVKFIGGGPAGNKIFPSMNKFGVLASECGIASDTTNGTPFGNIIDLYDLPDSGGTVPSAVGVAGWAVGFAGSTRLETVRFGFINPGWDTVTPSLPAGTGLGNAITNSNPYPVTIYQAAGAGYPTGQHIIDQHATDVAITASLPSFTLYPGEKVYYTGTLPLAWGWYGIA